MAYKTITTVPNKTPAYTLLPIYVMGLIWTAKLFNQKY
jgi:hypothetical protein